MEVITTNLDTSTHRREIIDETVYLVIPAVPLVEGVLNREYVPRDEVEHLPHKWNGRPIPLNHPIDDSGGFLSANTPDVVRKHVIGYVYNARAQDGTLRAEYWLNERKMRSMGGDALRVLQAIEAGDPIETSTAYWCNSVEEQGVFNSAEYGRVQRSIIPDHIALLTNERGACSIEDGCGANRSNAERWQARPTYVFSVNGAKVSAHDAAEAIKNCEDPTVRVGFEEDGQMVLTVHNCKEQSAMSDARKNDEHVEDEVEETTDTTTTEAALPTEPQSDPDTGEDLEDLRELAATIKALGGVEGLKEALGLVKNSADEQRAALVEGITANSDFTEEDLAPYGIDSLRKLHKATAKPDRAAQRANRRKADDRDADVSDDVWVSWTEILQGASE